ncbi:MAG: discoidin domain-containing protein [Elusimicrobiota bacterium]
MKIIDIRQRFVPMLFFILFLSCVHVYGVISKRIIAIPKNEIASVKASSEKDDNSARNAIDANIETRWESEWIDPGWIQFEFTKKELIGNVLIRWETASAIDYEISSSNDGNIWRKIVSVRYGRKGEQRRIDFAPVEAKYIKITGIKRATEYGYSIREVLFNVEEQIVRASSEKDSNLAEFAFDGNKETRWESEWSDSAWLVIKLGDQITVKGVKIQWENASAKKYEIQTSNDGIEWINKAEVEDGKEGEEKIIKFVPTPVSYIRIFCEERTSKYGYSIYEIEVFK